MRRLVYALTGVLMSTLPVPLQAEPPRAIVAHTIGSYRTDFTCANGRCVGDLVTCPAGHGLMTAKMIYLFMDGVCDDAGPTPCKRRLRGLLENCLDLKSGINVLGRMLSITMHGKFRFCFDDAAASDCTGTPPAGAVVGEGVNRMQGRIMLRSGAPMQASDELLLTDAQDFTIDGKETRVRSTLTVYDSTLQSDFFKCGKTGCGLAGTAVLQTSR
jgi:hypothetical protein